MDGTPDTLVVSFEDVPASEAGKKVAALRNQLLDDCPGITAVVRKYDSQTQDAGTFLELGLAAVPAVIVIAKGIANYLSRDRAGTLVMTRDGDVLFKGRSADAPAIAKALAPKSK